MIRLSLAAVALALAGCASDGSVTSSIPLGDVNVVADNFCAVARKVTWDVTDTWQTIDEARRHNERIDKLCGVPGEARPEPKTS